VARGLVLLLLAPLLIIPPFSNTSGLSAYSAFGVQMHLRVYKPVRALRNPVHFFLREHIYVRKCDCTCAKWAFSRRCVYMHMHVRMYTRAHVHQVGPNSSGSNHLHCSGIEFWYFF
jgi:hypothetical protein